MRYYRIDDETAKLCTNCKHFEGMDKTCRLFTNVVSSSISAYSVREDEEACGEEGRYFESKYQFTNLVDICKREND